MPALQTATELATFKERGAGTDSERRAAQWLAARLRGAKRTVEIEPFWCRPNWALAHAWHVALAIVGGIVSVSSARVGGALVLAALLSVIVDERLGVSPGRRLTPERASQNVVATPSRLDKPPIHLVITANYDAGRTGLVYRDRLRAPLTHAAAAIGRRAPGWLGWLVIAMAWLLVTAILRVDGARGTAIGIAQLLPTASLIIALALLIELGSSAYGPAASDNASGVAVALALASALDAAPPREVGVELVLQGAGDGCGIGLREFLKKRRRAYTPADTVVVGVAPCGSGRPRWWVSDGQLIPLRYFGRLTKLCAGLAREQPGLNLAPHRGRGATPAFRASSSRPAIAIGCLDDRERAPRSHQPNDVPELLGSSSLDASLEFGLLLIDAIDATVRSGQPSGRRHRIALRRPLAVLGGRERESPDQLRP